MPASDPEEMPPHLVEEIVNINTIVMNLNDKGSYSINGIAEATGLPWRTVKQIIETNTVKEV